MKTKEPIDDKFDVHVYFNAPLGGVLKRDAREQQRSVPQLVRYIVSHHYQNTEGD